jgi:hypothetical protein
MHRLKPCPPNSRRFGEQRFASRHVRLPARPYAGILRQAIALTRLPQRADEAQRERAPPRAPHGRPRWEDDALSALEARPVLSLRPLTSKRGSCIEARRELAAHSLKAKRQALCSMSRPFYARKAAGKPGYRRNHNGKRRFEVSRLHKMPPPGIFFITAA